MILEAFIPLGPPAILAKISPILFHLLIILPRIYVGEYALVPVLSVFRSALIFPCCRSSSWIVILILYKNINAETASTYGRDPPLARTILYRFEQGSETRPRKRAFEASAYTLLETASGKVERGWNKKEVQVDSAVSQGVSRSQV
jgi:hypothetical protein